MIGTIFGSILVFIYATQAIWAENAMGKPVYEPLFGRMFVVEHLMPIYMVTVILIVAFVVVKKVVNQPLSQETQRPENDLYDEAMGAFRMTAGILVACLGVVALMTILIVKVEDSYVPFLLIPTSVILGFFVMKRYLRGFVERRRAGISTGLQVMNRSVPDTALELVHYDIDYRPTYMGTKFAISGHYRGRPFRFSSASDSYHAVIPSNLSPTGVRARFSNTEAFVTVSMTLHRSTEVFSVTMQASEKGLSHEGLEGSSPLVQAVEKLGAFNAGGTFEVTDGTTLTYSSKNVFSESFSLEFFDAVASVCRDLEEEPSSD